MSRLVRTLSSSSISSFFFPSRSRLCCGWNSWDYFSAGVFSAVQEAQHATGVSGVGVLPICDIYSAVSASWSTPVSTFSVLVTPTWSVRCLNSITACRHSLQYCCIRFYKKLKNVSCEYDRLNGWNYKNFLRGTGTCSLPGIRLPGTAVLLLFLLLQKRQTPTILPGTSYNICGWQFLLNFLSICFNM